MPNPKIPLHADIREFRFPQDYQNVRNLWQSAGSGIQLRLSDESDEIVKKLQRDPDLFLVAENDGKLIGTVMGGYDGRRGMMYHLAVAQNFRKLGIGTSLMEELEKRLRVKGCVRYYLLVTKDNQDAIDFYERRGWSRMDLFAYGKDL